MVVVENHLMPVVNHMIWYEVGAADEPPGKSGLAHLLEHALFKGTKTIGRENFPNYCRKWGTVECVHVS